MPELDAFSLNVLLAAVGIAVVHTAVGPDHYLPFLMIGRARGWSRARILTVTGACGAGHVLSSLLLGGIGLLLGFSVGRLDAMESGRGPLAAWLLIGFGFAYALWGARRALRQRRGIEIHDHDGDVHVHGGGDRPHGHDHAVGPQTSFWALFVIFVLGPCEPLIPLFVLPASRGRWGLALLVGGVFGVVTVVTMMLLVALGHAGLGQLRLGSLERWSHSIAGAVIAFSGLAVVYLGL